MIVHTAGTATPFVGDQASKGETMRIRSPLEPGRRDIQAAKIDLLAWATEGQEEVLGKLFGSLTKKAQDTITWYQQSRRPKKRGAICLRVGAILLAAAAGFLPLVSQMLGRDGALALAPAWATVAVGLAATLLVLDRFFGCTSAWIRYIKAELAIQHLLEQFQLDWQAELAAGDAQAARKRAQKLLERAKAFLGQVNQVVQEETNAWIEEFRSTLKQIDELMKAQEVASAAAGLNIEVTNGEECDAGWTVTVDDGVERPYHGKTAGLRGVAPGIHAVHVAGTIKGGKRQAEVTTAVPAGGVATVQVTLC